MQMHVYPRLELIGDRDPVTKTYTGWIYGYVYCDENTD